MSRFKVHRYLILWVQWSLLLFGGYAFAASDDETIHVFYPVAPEPYRQMFAEIVSGIEDGSDNNVISHPVGPGSPLDEYKSLIETSKPGTVIMLGPLGKAFQAISEHPVTVLTGASSLTDADIAAGLTGISLSPDPASLFDQLLILEPGIQKISVVYHRETNGWLIDMAQNHALALGLEFESIEASDVREAANHYRNVLDHSRDGKHSLWLLRDPTLDEKGLLPDVLAQAWSTNCVVFSSDAAYVNRGALFSLFPDYYMMGKSLAGFAQQVLSGQPAQPLAVSDLKKALNTRTAEHLNLKLSRSQQRDYDVIYPSR